MLQYRIPIWGRMISKKQLFLNTARKVILTNIYNICFLGVLNTIILNISNNPSHLDLRICPIHPIQTVIKTNLSVNYVSCHHKKGWLHNHITFHFLSLQHSEMKSMPQPPTTRYKNYCHSLLHPKMKLMLQSPTTRYDIIYSAFCIHKWNQCLSLQQPDKILLPQPFASRNEINS